VTVPDSADGLVHTMEMLIGGRWQPAGSGRTEDVMSPFDGTVPVAGVAGVGGQRVITHPAIQADFIDAPPVRKRKDQR
jgi:hypothetical protein